MQQFVTSSSDNHVCDYSPDRSYAENSGSVPNCPCERSSPTATPLFQVLEMIGRLAPALHVRYCAAVRVELQFVEKVGALKRHCGISIFSDTCIQWSTNLEINEMNAPHVKKVAKVDRSASDSVSKCLGVEQT